MNKEDDIRLDQKVRAAWMYYIAGLNQSEIASQLGTSRPVVQRLIAAAKDEGDCVDWIASSGCQTVSIMPQLLKEKYQLTDCNIMPVYSIESTLDSVTFGCYQLMARYLQGDKPTIVGIGSGLTLKKTIKRIDFDSQNTRCVALISAMNEHGQCNYYDDVPLLFGEKNSGKILPVASSTLCSVPRRVPNVVNQSIVPQRLYRSA
ncbi:putative transcriptional repressor [Escherichia coli]|uniref:Putative transcriptional repressor n=1 Tax=Escherichia coli TaxID=562 RepID=A0A376Y693_ECOLX|nr:putative transcriptional repressor [Escherichia coli]